jgi:hypothetical protein
MKTVFARRFIAVVCLGAFGIIGTACIPAGVTLQPPPGGGNACPAGTWQLSSETITNALQTVLGSATVTGSGSGVTLTLTSGSPNTWSLNANQTLNITGSNFNVTASVNNASASGTHTISGSNITFTLQNVSGTVNVSGTAFGQPFSTSLPLGQSDDVQGLYGLSGTANYTCNADGSLTLSLPAVQMNFKQ